MGFGAGCETAGAFGPAAFARRLRGGVAAGFLPVRAAGVAGLRAAFLAALGAAFRAGRRAMRFAAVALFFAVVLAALLAVFLAGLLAVFLAAGRLADALFARLTAPAFGVADRVGVALRRAVFRAAGRGRFFLAMGQVLSEGALTESS